MYDFRITPEGGEPFEVKAGTRDLLVWEKVLPGRSMQKLAQDLHIADMYEIAFVAAKRLGVWAGTRPEFEATCELDFKEAVEPDPTSPAP